MDRKASLLFGLIICIEVVPLPWVLHWFSVFDIIWSLKGNKRKSAQFLIGSEIVSFWHDVRLERVGGSSRTWGSLLCRIHRERPLLHVLTVKQSICQFGRGTKYCAPVWSMPRQSMKYSPLSYFPSLLCWRWYWQAVLCTCAFKDSYAAKTFLCFL